jgi:16S rRNA (cytosine1402-N4)-methyltransferase
MVEEALGTLLEGGRTRILDGTVGPGGHAAELLARDGNVVLLGVDRDGEVLEVARERLKPFGSRVDLQRASYADLDSVMAEAGWENADGVLLDLGLSSYQLGQRERGFSFAQDGPLDLRFSREESEPASALLDRVSEEDLVGILRRFGEEPRARQIARAVKERVPRTTGELAELVCRVKRTRGGRVHPATQTFQALRIAVNHELDHLERFLRRFHRFLGAGGRAVLIAYHSLEDRLVKQRFALLDREGGGRVLTRRPLRPTQEEVARNRRSRGAKLRAFEKRTA